MPYSPGRERFAAEFICSACLAFGSLWASPCPPVLASPLPLPMMELRLHPDLSLIIPVLQAHNIAPAVSSSGIASNPWWTKGIYLSRPNSNISKSDLSAQSKWSLALMAWFQHVYLLLSSLLKQSLLALSPLSISIESCFFITSRARASVSWSSVLQMTDSSNSPLSAIKGTMWGWGQFLGSSSSGLALPSPASLIVGWLWKFQVSHPYFQQ